MAESIASVIEQADGQGSSLGSISAQELADRLPVRQHRALCAITGGSTFPQAAEAAGVSRATVYRWVQADPDFRAAYNAWQREQKESGRARLLKITEQAVCVVEKALIRNDEKVAVTLLREMGVMRPAAEGLTDPKLLRLQMQLQTGKREYRLDRDTLRFLLTKAGLSKTEQKDYLSGPRRPPILPGRPRETNQDKMRRDKTPEAPRAAGGTEAEHPVNSDDPFTSIKVDKTNETE